VGDVEGLDVGRHDVAAPDEERRGREGKDAPPSRESDGDENRSEGIDEHEPTEIVEGLGGEKNGNGEGDGAAGPGEVHPPLA
jgi:hypothetical protein